MVRTFAIVALPCLALAAEMSPPRIELNLSDLAPGHSAMHGWGLTRVVQSFEVTGGRETPSLDPFTPNASQI